MLKLVGRGWRCRVCVLPRHAVDNAARPSSLHAALLIVGMIDPVPTLINANRLALA